MRKATYAGSFDPPTNGHLHVIKTAAKLFDHLYVFVASNATKTGTFTPQERFTILQEHDKLREFIRGFLDATERKTDR